MYLPAERGFGGEDIRDEKTQNNVALKELEDSNYLLRKELYWKSKGSCRNWRPRTDILCQLECYETEA